MSTAITIHYNGVSDPGHPERAIPAPAPTVIVVPEDIPTWVQTNKGDCGYVPSDLAIWTGPDAHGISASYTPQLGLDVFRVVDDYLRTALPEEVPAWTAQLPAVHAAVVAAVEEAERTRLDVHASCEVNRAIMRSIQEEELAHAGQWLDSRTWEYHDLPQER